MEATAALLGRSCRILGKLTSGKVYGRYPGAKFGHFVGDVEAKSGYGDFKWGPDWGQVWPSWALLRYLEATALLLGQGWGILRAS